MRQGEKGKGKGEEIKRAVNYQRSWLLAGEVTAIVLKHKTSCRRHLSRKEPTNFLVGEAWSAQVG